MPPRRPNLCQIAVAGRLASGWAQSAPSLRSFHARWRAGRPHTTPGSPASGPTMHIRQERQRSNGTDRIPGPSVQGRTVRWHHTLQYGSVSSDPPTIRTRVAKGDPACDSLTPPAASPSNQGGQPTVSVNGRQQLLQIHEICLEFDDQKGAARAMKGQDIDGPTLYAQSRM